MQTVIVRGPFLLLLYVRERAKPGLMDYFQGVLHKVILFCLFFFLEGEASFIAHVQFFNLYHMHDEEVAYY